MKMLLNPLTDRQLPLRHFPSRQQAFIFRNWEMVPAAKLAEVLGTDAETVRKLAGDMGLPPQTRDLSVWMQKGYITVIRANWHLLPYAQLLQLLDWDEDHLALVLKEDDFLGHKLSEKPDCAPLSYVPLTEEQQKSTAKIRRIMETRVQPYLKEDVADPFDFFTDHYAPLPMEKPADPAQSVTVDDSWSLLDDTHCPETAFMAENFRKTMETLWNVPLRMATAPASRQIRLTVEPGRAESHRVCIEKDCITVTGGDSTGVLRGLFLLEDRSRENGGFRFAPETLTREPRFGARYIYSFCGLYNDAFEVDSAVHCPDSLLEAYARAGVNGVWMQAVLYRLIEFPFDPAVSAGWQQRLERLRGLIARAARWGIRIYLYINEPRSMPLSFFEKYPHLKGAEGADGNACMCTGVPEVQKYLAEGIETLCRSAAGLGGFFTITMSENLTNCYSRWTQDTCPRCRKRPAWEVVAEVNRIITESAHRVDPSIRVIAWDWSWKGEHFTDADIGKLTAALPKETIIMGKRESELPYSFGGVDGTVDDYAVSVPGLSPVSQRLWKHARESGHETAVKAQLNNSWECSTVPYLPVFQLLAQHMDSLIEGKVDHVMLSWTLGGYPSDGIRLCSPAFFRDPNAPDEKPDYTRVLRTMYGENAPKVEAAAAKFSRAFREFPFHIVTLYRGPQNNGPANLLFPEPTGFPATMTCYAYDDLEHWRSIYPEDVFEAQFAKLCAGWEEGLALLRDLPVCEFSDMAFVGYSLFRASLHQIRFIRARDRYLSGDESRKAVLRDIAHAEGELAWQIWRIMLRNAAIGYEAANHYYFGRTALLEKLLNCADLEAYYA